MIEQSDVASSEKEQLSMKNRESVKLEESAKNAKQKPRNQHQSRYSPSSLAVITTDSLELKLAKTAIHEHKIIHEHLIFRI